MTEQGPGSAALHEVDDYLFRVMSSFDRVPARPDPHLIVTMGCQCSGKSTCVKEFLARYSSKEDEQSRSKQENWHNANIDDLLRLYSLRHNVVARALRKCSLCAREPGNAEKAQLSTCSSQPVLAGISAFKSYVTRLSEKEYWNARQEGFDQLNSALIQAAMERKCDIIFETTASGSKGWAALGGLVWICHQAALHNYNVTLLYPLATKGEIKARAERRTEETGQNTALDKLEQEHENAAYNFVHYIAPFSQLLLHQMFLFTETAKTKEFTPVAVGRRDFGFAELALMQLKSNDSQCASILQRLQELQRFRASRLFATEIPKFLQATGLTQIPSE